MLKIAIMLALTIGVQDVPREPKHWPTPGLRLAGIPRVEFPQREGGVVQARVTCTVVEGGRVRNCRIDRVMPQGTRFGRAALRGMHRSRVIDRRAVPGDTFSLDIWGCAFEYNEAATSCPKPEWPVDGEGDAH